jgi:hypothetical protein
MKYSDANIKRSAILLNVMLSGFHVQFTFVSQDFIIQQEQTLAILDIIILTEWSKGLDEERCMELLIAN